MEVLLGIDDIIFISILNNKLPAAMPNNPRRLGIGLALVMRLLLLASVSIIVRLRTPLFTPLDYGISWRDLILITGGAFLVWKATRRSIRAFLTMVPNVPKTASRRRSPDSPPRSASRGAGPDDFDRQHHHRRRHDPISPDHVRGAANGPFHRRQPFHRDAGAVLSQHDRHEKAWATMYQRAISMRPWRSRQWSRDSTCSRAAAANGTPATADEGSANRCTVNTRCPVENWW